MHKFFISKSQISDSGITLIGDDVLHISKVLRLRTGDQILVCDREGMEFYCTIDEIAKKEIHCSIQSRFENHTEAPLRITLFQGLPKSGKMDLIIQKGVELGIVEIYPVITKRAVVRTDDRELSGRLERWNRIAEEAAKQSNRGIVPLVHSPIRFEEALDKMSDMDFRIVPYEREEAMGIKTAAQNITNIHTAGILIGPEGGFEEVEIQSCISAHIQPVTLGPRILRTETAGFVAASILQYEFGDLGGLA